jgi:hypothetical protein
VSVAVLSVLCFAVLHSLILILIFDFRLSIFDFRERERSRQGASL